MRRDIPAGYITQKEIAATKKFYQIGSMVSVHTYKSQMPESMGHTGEVHRAEIISKHPHFAVVRLRGGVLDSVSWVDLVLERRKKKSGEKSPEIKN